MPASIVPLVSLSIKNPTCFTLLKLGREAFSKLELLNEQTMVSSFVYGT